jgi:DNA-binding PadR family transcriptional regulator
MTVQGISAHGTRILHILAALGPRPVEARELFGAARIPPAVGYPIVHRLCDRGLIRRQWEDIDPVTEGRPRTCSYALTDLGTAQELATRSN